MAVYPMRPNWPHPGCVGLWHLAGNATDSSGNGNDGSPSAGVYYSPIGRWHTSPRITDDYWTLSYTDALKVSDLTISAWYCGTDDRARSVLFSCGGISIGEYFTLWYGYFFETKSGKLNLRINDLNYTSGTTINDDNWHFLMATRSDSVTRLYVDGRLDGGWANPAEIVYSGGQTGAFIAAAYQAGGVPSTPGVSPNNIWLDELMMENYAIEPKEALDRYLFQVGMLG